MRLGMGMGIGTEQIWAGVVLRGSTVMLATWDGKMLQCLVRLAGHDSAEGVQRSPTAAMAGGKGRSQATYHGVTSAVRFLPPY